MTVKHASFLLILILVLAGAAFFVRFPAGFSAENLFFEKYGREAVKNIEIADTPELRALGLSGRDALPGGEGVLFVFDHPDLWGFWMKDMKFSIDIVWMDENFSIVHVERAVSPLTYPKIFYPTAKARYVLEVNAGESAKLNF